jgi:hypothetical protein
VKKIPTLFVRNSSDRSLVTDEIAVPLDVYRAIKERGIARRKWDGTCCMVRDGVLLKRYTHKVGRGEPPFQFEPATEVDPVTGKQEGWLPVSSDDPADDWHREALRAHFGIPPDGTYELVGPKVQGNPEKCQGHALVRHASTETLIVDDLTVEGLRDQLAVLDWEGLVFYLGDQPVAKIKKRDLGLER